MSAQPAASPATTDDGAGRPRRWPAVAAVAAAAALVLAARLAGTPVADRLFLGSTYPISGHWRGAPEAWLLVPVVTGAALCCCWPRLAGRLPRRALGPAAAAVAAAWTCALALVDGPGGFTDPLSSRHGYLHDVPRVHELSSFLATFNQHVLDPANGPLWTTHVSGHPPGALLVFVLLDRVGLGGTGWAAAVCVAGGALAVPCVLAVVRRLGGAGFARRAAVFVPLAPAALWVASTADALFAGVAAAGLYALVRGAGNAGARSDGWAALGGLLLGCCLYLNYGLALLVLPAVVFVLATRWRSAAGVLGSVRGGLRPLLVGGAVAVALLLAGRLAGYDWWQGLQLAAQRTRAGVWPQRPTWYFLLADPAELLVCVGPVVVAGAALLRRCRVSWVPAGAALAVAAAVASNLSKGEVERIYLPFAMWLLPCAATLIGRPRSRAAVGLLAAQLAWAVLVTATVETTW